MRRAHPKDSRRLRGQSLCACILFTGALAPALSAAADARAQLELAARALRVDELVARAGVAIDAQGTRDLAARWQGMHIARAEPTPLTTRLAVDLATQAVAFESNGRVNADAEEHLRFVFRGSTDTLLIDYLNGRAFGIGPDAQSQAERYRATVPHLLIRSLLDTGAVTTLVSAASDATRGVPAGDEILARWPDGRAVAVQLDPRTHYLSAVRTEVDLAVDGPVEVTWTYGPYTTVDGVPFPAGHAVSLSGKAYESLQYERVTIGRPEAADFSPPPWIAVPAPPPAASSAAPKPALPAAAAPAAPESPLQEIRPGVFLFRNARGGFHPLIVVQADGLLVVDAPAVWHELSELPPSQSDAGAGSDAIGRRLLAELAERFPGQPVRRLALTHHHGDHMGGAIPFVDAGVEILAAPATGDALGAMLQRHGRAADAGRVRIVDGRLRIDDASRPVELIDVGQNPHAEGMLVAYLPDEHILYQSDLFDAQSAAAFPARARLPVMEWFSRWLDGSGLEVGEIFAIHGSARITDAQLAAIRDGTALRTRVAVIGATGRQGGAVTRELLRRGMAVRAVARNPDSPRARALAAAGAEIERADLDDADALQAALTGVHAVFAMTDFWEHGREREVAHGRNIVAAARAARVRHLVFSSVASADRATGISHFDSKYEIEEAIRASGVPFTILRPVSFMENWSDARSELAQGWWVDPQSPDSRQQLIALPDLARFVADAIERPDRWLGAAVDLAGDELTIAEMIAVASRVFGHEIRYRRMPWQEAERELGSEMTSMLRWFERTGYGVDVPALRSTYPWLTRFEDYLAGLPVDSADDSADITAAAVTGLVDGMATGIGAADMKAPVVQLEWRGTTRHPFDSHRAHPPWDEGLLWNGRVVDLARGTTTAKQVAVANGARSVTGTSIGPNGAGLAYNALSGSVRTLDSASVEQALEEAAPYSPLLALALMRRHPERIRPSADRTCRGRRMRTITYRRPSAGELHFLVDPATRRVECVDHDFTDYDGSIVDLRVENDDATLMRGGVMHPAGYTEYARGTVVRRMDLVHMDIGSERLGVGAPPDSFRQSPSPPADLRAFQVRELAPGVWFVGEGVMYQLFVEFDDFMVAVDGVSGDVERRVRAVSDRIPRKPVRYLVVTHPHADHLHGVRAFAELGATILVAESHLAAVRRQLGEQLSQRLQPVADRHTIESAGRRLDVLDLGPTPHSQHLLAAYLPAERLLFQSDLMVVSQWDPVPPASGNMRALAAAIDRLDLDVGQIVSPHTPVLATQAHLADSVARAATSAPAMPMPDDERWRTDPAASW